MIRHTCRERPHWKALAQEYGFHFHTINGEPYWNEAGYYQFTLRQIEDDLEAPTAELHQMCLDAVDTIVNDERLLTRCQIPAAFHDAVRNSWQMRQPSLYSRMDLVYDGRQPAKLLENNADTPTSVYETGFWQWLWLEQQVDAGVLHRNADQFNSLQEKLIDRFDVLKAVNRIDTLYFSCCRDSVEDRGTAEYLMDCARQARLTTDFIYIDDIGATADGQLTDLAERAISGLFKLYPWEMMLREAFAHTAVQSDTRFIEPLWKSVLSNKGILPVLWSLFPGHPNLLPAYFADDPAAAQLRHYVSKPLFSREGANISIVRDGRTVAQEPGPYGAEGHIIQALQPLPRFGNRHTLIGSWVVGDEPAGISVREDTTLITRDTSQFLPHIIL